MLAEYIKSHNKTTLFLSIKLLFKILLLHPVNILLVVKSIKGREKYEYGREKYEHIEKQVYTQDFIVHQIKQLHKYTNLKIYVK